MTHCCWQESVSCKLPRKSVKLSEKKSQNFTYYSELFAHRNTSNINFIILCLNLKTRQDLFVKFTTNTVKDTKLVRVIMWFVK